MRLGSITRALWLSSVCLLALPAGAQAADPIKERRLRRFTLTGRIFLMALRDLGRAGEYTTDDIPADAVMYNAGYDSMFDQWTVVIASREFAPFEDGHMVPELTVRMNRLTPDHVI